MTLNYRALDWKLIGAVLALSLVGIVLILSAQYHADSMYERTFYMRQALWLIMALILFSIIIHLPLRFFDISAYLLYGLALFLLVLVLMVNKAGPARWFSFGPIHLAPSDIAKLALILTLARFFAYTKLPVTSKRRLLLSLILTAIPLALVVRQPDLGTALVFPVILLVMWFWSGLSPWFLLLILSPLVSLVAAFSPISWAVYFGVLILFLALLRPGTLFSIALVVVNIAFGVVTPYIWGRLAAYQKQRILSFIDPGADPRGAGYQIIQSKISIGSGGIWGKGLLSGSQTRLDFLPERHTDFIFSVLGEELGLWGAMIVLLLFAIVFYRAIRIAARCRSRFASLVVMGASGILLFQFLINIGMTLGFMPVTGLALPFLSYGGTSLMLSWGLIALIVSADYHWQEY
jgi:rod shape determining protein RodA